MLAHELAHLAYWDEPDGIDPNDRSDFEERRFEIIFNPAENKGKAVEIEASVQAALGEGQRISYFSAVGHSNMPTSLEVGYDYSPTGFGSGVVDVVFVDAYNDMALSQSGTITLSDYSATDRFLLVLGGANNSVIGGNSGDYIHTGGGLDFVGVSGGSDYIDGGSGEGLGIQGDTLQFGSQLVTVVLSLADGTGIEGDAIFAALKSATETDHFTDFERVLFSDGANNLAFDSDAVLDALASENVTIVGGEGTDQIDGQLLDQGVIIDFAAGEMYFQDEAIAKLSLVGFENASGSDFNDVLRGNEEANELLGLGGDDFIFFDFADGANVNGGAGRDVALALGQDGVTVDMAAQGLECVIGCDGADTITVGEAEGALFAAGGGGSDTFIVRNGEDGYNEGGPRVLWGGGGADTFEFEWASYAHGIAVVQIEGLTEETFSTLTLADLGLGSLDLSMFQAIVLNPDQSDRFLYDGSVFTSALYFSDSDGHSSSVRSHASSFISEALGRSLSVQGVYQNNYVIETTPNFEWDDMENIISVSRFTGAIDAFGAGIFDVTDYDPLSASDQEEAMDLYEYYFTNTDQVVVQVATDPQYNAFGAPLWVVGGTFSGEALSANGQLTAGPLGDPGTTPFDWLLAA